MSTSGPSGPLVSKLTFSQKKFRNTIRVSNGLDPDQDQCSVGPDLGPNCSQRFTADEKSFSNNIICPVKVHQFPRSLIVFKLPLNFKSNKTKVI